MTDKDAFCDSVRQYERSMYALAYSIVRNEADAEEVISEAIYRAFCHLDTLKNDHAFKPWILRIVHNTALETVRKHTKEVHMEQLPDIAVDSGESDITTRVFLRAAVERLKQPYRTVVVLFYYENLSASKIAQITSTNAVSVRQQLSRARKMLREILEEDFQK